MPHFPRMLPRHLIECFCIDGWAVAYPAQRDGESSVRAQLTKPAHQRKGLTLTHELSSKRVRAMCQSAGITAERLEELRQQIVLGPRTTPEPTLVDIRRP